MENRAYALAAGLFTLLLGIGVAVAALWFSGDVVQTQDYELISRHPVSGLNAQAPVRFRGVTVGKVLDIRFDPKEARAILVRIQVNAGTPLTQGTFAKLGSQGVTGLSYVMLDDDGTKPAPLTREGDQLARIEVRPSFFDTVTASGEEMIANFNQVAKRVDVLLSDDNQKQLMKMLAGVDQAAARATALANSLEPTIKALEPTIKALPALISETSVVLKRADTLIVNVNQRVESFERAAKGAEQLMISGTALSDTMLTESVPRLNLLLEDVQRSSRSLERLLHDINDQPHSLIFGRNPLPPGPGEPGFSAERSVQ